MNGSLSVVCVALAVGLPLTASSARACGGGSGQFASVAEAWANPSHLSEFLNGMIVGMTKKVATRALGEISGIITGMLFDIAEFIAQDPSNATNLVKGMQYFEQLNQTKDMGEVEAMKAGFTVQSYQEMMSQI